MDGIHRPLGWLAATLLALALSGQASASAFEAHNFMEPPFGSFVNLSGLGVDQSNGDVYAFNAREVKVFGAAGGLPENGGPASFTGAGGFKKGNGEPGSFGTLTESTGSVAVDGACVQHERLTGKALTAGECVAFDPSNGAVYVQDPDHGDLDKYRLNGSGEYEFVCALEGYGEGSGKLCFTESEGTTTGRTRGAQGGTFSLQSRGAAVDSAGDVYVGGSIGYGSNEEAIFEFNPEGEAVNQFLLSSEGGRIGYLTVSSSGTIYVQQSMRSYEEAYGVVELKRSSLTGAVEGEPTLVPNTENVQGLAFDQADGQLLLSFESAGEALNAAHEVVSRFGSGVVSHGGAIAVDEGSGEVYVDNGLGQAIDRFGGGVPATLPAVDAPPPSFVDVTRTSALLAAMVDTGDATTNWQVQYVVAGEYEPGGANPYAAGGSTPLSKLAPSTEGTAVGPLPLTGLSAGTTYDYRLVATNELGTTYGPDYTFTTAPATVPLVMTGAASEVTQTGVVLTGTVDTRELQTSYEFEVGTDTSYGGAKLFGNAGSGGTEVVSASLQFLIPGATYHYRLVASNEDGTTYGQDIAFTTPGVAAGIAQPGAAQLIPSPTVTFPSVARAIRKPRGVKAPKQKRKTKRKARRRVGRRARR